MVRVPRKIQLVGIPSGVDMVRVPRKIQLWRYGPLCDKQEHPAHAYLRWLGGLDTCRCPPPARGATGVMCWLDSLKTHRRCPAEGAEDVVCWLGRCLETHK